MKKAKKYLLSSLSALSIAVVIPALVVSCSSSNTTSQDNTGTKSIAHIKAKAETRKENSENIVKNIELQSKFQNNVDYAPFSLSKNNTDFSKIFNISGNVSELTSYNVIKTDYINGSVEIEVFGKNNFHKIFTITGFIKNPNANYLNDYTYQVNGNSVSIIGLKPNVSLTNLSFPSYYLTKNDTYLPITQINPDAFFGKNISSVNFDSLITTIGNRAFMNNQIQDMIIAKNITKIGEQAFIDNPFNKIGIPNQLVIENPNCTWIKTGNLVSFSKISNGIEYIEVGNVLYQWSSLSNGYTIAAN